MGIFGFGKDKIGAGGLGMSAIIGEIPTLDQEKFIERNIISDLRYYINALVAPIQSEDAFVTGLNVYPKSLETHIGSFVYLRDTLASMFINNRVYIYKTQFIDKETRLEDGRRPPPETFYLNSNIENRYDPDYEWTTVGKPLVVVGSDETTINQLKWAYSLLYHAYKKLNFSVVNDRVVFSKSGYNEITYGAAGSDATSSRIKMQMESQLESMRSKSMTMIDPKDTLTTLGIDVSFVSPLYDFVKSEVCRILKKSESLLFGRSATGLNSTQKYEMVQLENDLEADRQAYVYPLLNAFGIEYTTKLQLDTDTYSALGNSLGILGIDLTEEAKALISTKISAQLIAGLSANGSK